MTWPQRLSDLGLGLAAGVAVGAFLLESVQVRHFRYAGGSREGFEVEAFGFTIRHVEYPNNTRVTAAEVVWRCLSVAAALAASLAAGLWTMSALATRGCPQTEQATDYDDKAAEPGVAPASGEPNW
jgi:hypothetical protein